MSQEQLAERVGSTQPQIARLETGKRRITKEWAERLAPHLGITPDQLLFGKLVSSNAAETPIEVEDLLKKHLPNAVVTGILDPIVRTIPLFGQAVGGVDGEFVMNGIPLAEVLAPPVLARVKGAYAVTVSGDSMSPRYEDGETCYIDPTRRVKRGDYVVAQVQIEENGPHLAFVKRFVRHNSVELVLEQFNPPKELRFDARHVVSVHYIVMAGSAI